MFTAPRLVLYLASLSCAAAICPPDYQMDIAFVVDSDGSTARSQYHIFYDVIIEFMNRYPIGENQTRVGLVTYDTNPPIVIPPTGDKASLLKKIRRVEYNYNSVNAIICLTIVSRFFSLAEPREEHVRKVVVLETDGTGRNRQTTIRSAQNLKDQGIEVFVLGIKPRIDHDELVGVATKPEFYFEANSYADYKEFVELLSERLCNDPQDEENE